MILKIYKTNRSKLLDEAIELLLERHNFKEN
ncbi:ribbon-helix-helix domain-containing protein [Clostridium perfringens]|nr:ribbon-helix-helix domain-containing protein [Clostridium perfringens]